MAGTVTSIRLDTQLADEAAKVLGMKTRTEAVLHALEKKSSHPYSHGREPAWVGQAVVKTASGHRVHTREASHREAARSDLPEEAGDKDKGARAAALSRPPLVFYLFFYFLKGYWVGYLAVALAASTARPNSRSAARKCSSARAPWPSIS